MSHKRKSQTEPCAPESEQVILGALMKYQESAELVMEIVKSENDFYDHRHRMIWKVMMNLKNRELPCDIPALIQELKCRNELEKVGGRTYLAELAEHAGSPQMAVSHAGIVLDKSSLRQLVLISEELAAASFAQDRSADEIIDEVEARLLKVSQRRDNISENAVSTSDLAREYAESLVNETKALRYIETPIPELNQMITGLFHGEVIIIGGPPSMGKTSFALDLCRHAVLQNKCVLYSSLDQTKESILMRQITSETGVKKARLAQGRLDSGLQTLVQDAIDDVASRNRLFVFSRAGQTVYDIRLQAQRIKRTEGLDMIVIDYVQQLRSAGRFENRNQEVTNVSKELKRLAKDLDVILVVISQLNRNYDALLSDQFPRPSMLRDSGALEQDANVIIFPWIPCLFAKSKGTISDDEYRVGCSRTGDVRAYIVVAKNKDDETGHIECRWDPKRMRFYSKSYVGK